MPLRASTLCVWCAGVCALCCAQNRKPSSGLVKHYNGFVCLGVFICSCCFCSFCFTLQEVFFCNLSNCIRARVYGVVAKHFRPYYCQHKCTWKPNKFCCGALVSADFVLRTNCKDNQSHNSISKIQKFETNHTIFYHKFACFMQCSTDGSFKMFILKNTVCWAFHWTEWNFVCSSCHAFHSLLCCTTVNSKA